MASRSPGLALPVRILASSWRVPSMAFFMASSVSCRIFVSMPSPWAGRRAARADALRADLFAHRRRMHQRADPLAGHDAPQVARLAQIEHHDREIVVHAQGDGGRV